MQQEAEKKLVEKIEGWGQALLRLLEQGADKLHQLLLPLWQMLKLEAEQQWLATWLSLYGAVTLLLLLFIGLYLRRRSRRRKKASAGLKVEPKQPLARGLQKSQSRLREGLAALFGNSRPATLDAMLEELEALLLQADFGVATTQQLVTAVRARAGNEDLEQEQLYQLLKTEIAKILQAQEKSSAPSPVSGVEILLVLGVNGTGKTTSVGKLAYHAGQQGKRAIIAAADTFRAAAAEQLQTWGQRAGAHVVRHQAGADPGAVVYDAIQAANARHADLLLVDTAGRLHTKVNLMEELKKIRRVIQREVPDGPHHTWLVVDATTGQNALSQAKMFQEAVAIDGLILTKLDGTAKGGIVVAIAAELGVPVKYVGIGEQAGDLRPFVVEDFVDALLGDNGSA